MTDKFGKTLEDVKKLSGSKRERAESLASNLIFQHNELEKLQAILEVKGWTEPYKNGANQHGTKKATEGEAYNALMKSYVLTIKQLNDLLASVPEEVDALEGKYF